MEKSLVKFSHPFILPVVKYYQIRSSHTYLFLSYSLATDLLSLLIYSQVFIELSIFSKYFSVAVVGLGFNKEGRKNRNKRTGSEFC